MHFISKCNQPNFLAWPETTIQVSDLTYVPLEKPHYLQHSFTDSSSCSTLNVIISSATACSSSNSIRFLLAEYLWSIIFMYGTTITVWHKGGDDMHWNGNVVTLMKFLSFVTSCSRTCHFDNFRCNEWLKFRHNDNISIYGQRPWCYCNSLSFNGDQDGEQFIVISGSQSHKET